MIPPKVHNSPAIKPKDIGVNEMSDKEFKRTIIKMINEFQENTEKQLNELRKSVHNMNEKFSTKIEILKKNQMELLGMKDLIN